MEYNGFISRELAEAFAATCNGKVEQYEVNYLKVPGNDGPVQMWRVIDQVADERMEVVSVRMPYALFERARLMARNEETHTSDIIRRALEAYVK